MIRASAFFAAVLAAAQACIAQDAAGAAEPDPADVRAKLRRMLAAADAESSSNSDGSIRVEGNGTMSYPDRSVVLEFLSDLRLRVNGALGGDPMPDGSVARLAVAAFTNAGDAAESRAFVHRASVSRPARLGGGFAVSVRIPVENPGAGLDPRQLALRAVDGTLAAAVAAEAARPDPERSAPPRRPPEWFAAGLARTFDAEARQADYDGVRAAWARASLPPLRHLCAAGSPYPAADPALAAELVSWWLDFPDRGKRWAEVRRRLASGEEWTPRLFVETGPGSGTAGGDGPGSFSETAADRDWDSWLVARRRLVLSPGVTTRAHVVRTLALARLVPGMDGVPEDFADSPQPLARIFEPSAREWAQTAAARKRAMLVQQAVGRGDAFRKAAADLSEALSRLAFGRGPSPDDAGKAAAALSALADSATENRGPR